LPGADLADRRRRAAEVGASSQYFPGECPQVIENVNGGYVACDERDFLGRIFH